MLLVIIPVALYFACVANAVRGGTVGLGLAFAIPAIAIWFATMAAVYWFAFLVSQIGFRQLGEGAKVEVETPADFHSTDSDASSIEASS